MVFCSKLRIYWWELMRIFKMKQLDFGKFLAGGGGGGSLEAQQTSENTNWPA